MQTQFSNTFLIIDDEDLARAELCRQIGSLLPSFLGIEAANLSQARSLLLSHELDGVFLDLEMPGEHGLSFLPDIRAMQLPVVITSAHDNYALDAFDGDVTDYILKPIESSRLTRALTRMRHPSHSDAKNNDLIILGDQSHYWPLRPEEIILAEAQGSYVKIFLKDRKPIMLSRSLKDIENLLPSRQFIRANRSQIVRLHCLESISRNESGSLTAEVDGVSTIEFSRRQAKDFRQRHGL